MTANYHTHTARCRHAVGTEEEYIKKAIDSGLKILGFSDHTPYFFSNGYSSPARMEITEMPDYFNTLLTLKEKYKSQIEIKIGFEMEYYPKYFRRLTEEYKKYPVDYMILGQHFIDTEDEPDSISVFNPVHERARLTAYTDQCIEALETDLFTYIAHPDCFNYVPLSDSDSEFALSEYERLIRAAMRTGSPLEFNLCGLRYGRNYPNPSFWRLVGRLGATAVIGCDAHAPEHVCNARELDKAYGILNEFSVNITEDIKLKAPCR